MKVQENFLIRRDFSKIDVMVKISDLIELQKRSYEAFLQKDVPPEKRKREGLQKVFMDLFPVENYNRTASLDFVKYRIEDPVMTPDECKDRGETYSVSLWVTLALAIMIRDEDDEEGQFQIKDVKEREVYFGEIPMMTEDGHFIINGMERVVVSQLHRSPGVFFEKKIAKTKSRKILYSGRIIPERGSWLEIEFDSRDILHARIDKRKKIPVTILLHAFGYSTEEILDFYYPQQLFKLNKDGSVQTEFSLSQWEGKKLQGPMRDAENGEVLIDEGEQVTKENAPEDGKQILLNSSEIFDKVVSRDVYEPSTGEMLVAAGEKLTQSIYLKLFNHNIDEVYLAEIENSNAGPFVYNTMCKHQPMSDIEAKVEIYKALRPGEHPLEDVAESFFYHLFLDPKRYDLMKVGRKKINDRFGLNYDIYNDTTLKGEDILHTIRYLCEIKLQKHDIDDIDHLGNRRVRPVGELLENQFRIGLTRLESNLRERMSVQDIDSMLPTDLINVKPLSAIIKKFFASGQLSQYMDQTNPLAETTHKRRLSALGPGGLTRERAGFEVRDVHPSHYGRICPIETPEGPNIGLISSLAIYAKVNEFGFIETPYIPVKNGKPLNKVEYLDAFQEQGKKITESLQLFIGSSNGKKELPKFCDARYNGEFVFVPSKEVDYIDVASNQMLSVAASLIPFLEHDDANRALMGSNMQRQAVPLHKTEPPFVGTGMEKEVAKYSRATVTAKRDGVVVSADANRIIVKTDDSENPIDIYYLKKFEKSNQDTCKNQRPIVNVGDRVKRGDVIADGMATACGELALGKNLLVAFMPWEGYNFEDAILISERLVRDNVFDSIHIKEFEVVARETHMGKEEITRDIPNVSEEALKNLDESGIIRIGAKVKPGDILVGKITPRGETQLSPEEKLLRAIFGKKAASVKDSSFRVPNGVEGTVIDVKVYLRRGTKKNKREQEIEREQERLLVQEESDRISILTEIFRHKVAEITQGKKLKKSIKNKKGEILLEAGTKLSYEKLIHLNGQQLKRIEVVDKDESAIAEDIKKAGLWYEKAVADTREDIKNRLTKLKGGYNLQPGVLKKVKVKVATKRRISIGDKLAGRHGNKGVISKILPVEDMPHLEDGTPVDIVLSPLGVPSRMNVGQLFELHLGLCSYMIGKKIQEMLANNASVAELREFLKKVLAVKKLQEFVDTLDDDDVIALAEKFKDGLYMNSPSFQGASEEDIKRLLKELDLPEDGRLTLYDGRTGEPFDSPIAVGSMYIMKLIHMVEDKVHARSTGPYSLITQQPLGGKAQFGGQRLGEMEVWALEAYGAAYTLQEFLTVKSDDVQGRIKMYESIVKGDNTLKAGIPEPFKVLIKELRGLCLDVQLLKVDKKKMEE